MPPKSAYLYDEFRKACGRKKGAEVIVLEKAQDDALEIFKLKEEDLLQFIFQNGFDYIKHFNTSKHRDLPGVLIDEYEFRTCSKKGYLAFFKSKLNKWILKSFHLSKEMNTYLGDKLKESIEMKRKRQK